MSFDVFEIKIWTLSLHNWNSVVYNQVFGSHVSTHNKKNHTEIRCTYVHLILSNLFEYAWTCHIAFMAWKFHTLSENVRKKKYITWTFVERKKKRKKKIFRWNRACNWWFFDFSETREFFVACEKGKETETLQHEWIKKANELRDMS